eukprot:Blabericola_migrator_1__919@NODE_1227_length_5049_cov_163_123645_g832_i0_p2_GENE_NODE_1227_length_5049_cov_163_123645_g832_i0NODE_1227_length_5049_cov_163_123645_g832_i0_p2_ORF_typecomplete_len323_score48_18Bromodomain/PF00439_25/2_6e23_NODE_1227_length_5049_cov_163_123645_g832_i039684936
MTTAVDTAILAQMLARLRKQEDAYPFLKPVDWKKMELHDYPHIITKPMDLQTVGRRLRDGLYTEPVTAQFLADLQQIWNNCRDYNDESTEIYAMADRMEIVMWELIKELLSPEAQASVQLNSNTKIRNIAASAGTSDGRQKRRRTTTGSTVRRGSDDDSASQADAVATPPPRKKKNGRGPGRPKKNAGRPSEAQISDHGGDFEMTDESNDKGIKVMVKESEVTEERRALHAKFLTYCKLLNRIQTAQILCMIAQEMGQQLPAEVLTAPHGIVPARGRRPAQQVCVLNLDLLNDKQIRRICSVMKLFARCDQPQTSVVRELVE